MVEGPRVKRWSWVGCGSSGENVKFAGLLGYNGSAAMYIKFRLYAEAGDTTGETRRDLGYGRRDGSCQVPRLAAKTEEDERRRTGKRMVDLTLNEAF